MLIQDQNRYVFPGIGLGTIVSRATCVTNNMIYASGTALPEMLMSEEVAMGLLWPALSRIRDVNVRVARSVIRAAQQDRVDAAQQDRVDRATHLRQMDDEALDEWVHGNMYDPL
ncbi:NAD(P)-binding Rossmann-fold containing protein [Glarea lozoyensis ATCC 20868]|uniref:NAD(P)-binding Rossmann-fold containing protein n=1 Tax=Glarea lozoyensis (strain ATCC 20868 / MF5171) TaxID=1116229 RepID=S3CMR8_GLAL2|nr:NAD(P)-binding Rossmann-fold containing protein [Glarea lozoyensis ATCC 20868]EPE26504.1 NAD(P)-binding Rossmann-fold containing protein [Glarea lozoyensis ATCC 20868]